MIADQLRRLFSYNTWAWQHVFQSVTQLEAADYFAPDRIFSHSIHSLLVHCLAAEQIWYVRCQGESPTSLLNPDDYADYNAVISAWSAVRHKWGNYVQWLTDEDCRRLVSYQTTTGQRHNLPLFDILQHVINHSTEHRSQLTPLLYALGYPTQPLDYVRYRLGF